MGMYWGVKTSVIPPNPAKPLKRGFPSHVTIYAWRGFMRGDLLLTKIVVVVVAVSSGGVS